MAAHGREQRARADPEGGERVNYSIRLGFLTADSKTININIPRANPDVTGAEAREAMDRILQTRIVAAATGEPSVADRADLIATEELDYNL